MIGSVIEWPAIDQRSVVGWILDHGSPGDLGWSEHPSSSSTPCCQSQDSHSLSASALQKLPLAVNKCFFLSSSIINYTTNIIAVISLHAVPPTYTQSIPFKGRLGEISITKIALLGKLFSRRRLGMLFSDWDSQVIAFAAWASYPMLQGLAVLD